MRRYWPAWATGLAVLLILTSVPALIVTEWGAALFALGLAVFFFGTNRQAAVIVLEPLDDGTRVTCSSVGGPEVVGWLNRLGDRVRKILPVSATSGDLAEAHTPAPSAA